MKLIRNIRIDDFRSIAAEELEVDQGYLPIVGPNNSGKSNLLRALNLFFAGSIEPDNELDLRRDFHNPGRKKKKRIAITIHFKLPNYFNYRKNIRAGLNETLGREFVIRKTWALDPATRRSVLASVEVDNLDGDGFSELDSSGRSRVDQFLNLIRFRYHPNHIHPSEVLEGAQGELQNALLSRLRKTQQIDPEEEKRLFSQISELASQLTSPIATNLRDAAPKLEEMELSTPKTLTDLVFSFVPKLRVRGGEKLDALMHGSGLQSYLMYLILAFLDTQFGTKFGWQQATIWAIEEPEAYLHQSLQHKVAEYLAESGSGERFQIFSTTHSDVFGRYAQQGLLCHLNEGKTQWSLYPSRVLAGEAAARGVVPYVHPLLISSQKPLLLVEGKTDREYFELAYALLGQENPWDVRSIASLDPDSDLGGIDGLAKYLEQNRMPLRTRPLESPVFVIVDWNENKRKVNKIAGALDAHPTSKAVQWQKDNSNTELGQSFAGIERFLGTDVIREAGGQGVLELRAPPGEEYPLEPRERKDVNKVALAELVQQRSNREDVVHFAPMIETLIQELEESIERGRQLLRDQVRESEQTELKLD